jgi:hypothetical protein
MHTFENVILINNRNQMENSTTREMTGKTCIFTAHKINLIQIRYASHESCSFVNNRNSHSVFVS